MRAKEFLVSANMLSVEIRALTSTLEIVSGEYEAAKKSLGDSKILKELQLKQNDLKANIESRLCRLFEIKRDIFTVVTAVERENQRIVLIMHYINNMTFEEIAEYMGYDERYVYRLNKEAISCVQKILDEAH